MEASIQKTRMEQPLLVQKITIPNDHHEVGSNNERRRWYRSIFYIDVQELKKQSLIALPMTVTYILQYAINLVSVMFAGHLGEVELAGATLANSFAWFFAYSLLVGISGAMETLCGQAYGAKEYAILGVYLQASVIVTSIVSIPLTVLFLYAEPVLLLIGQDIKVSSKVSVYLRGLIPGIYAFAITESLVRFLQAQSIVMPLTLCSLFLLMGHVFLCYILVHMTNLRFGGAALANSISYWLLACCLILYVKHASDFEKTWKGFSKETFKVMRPFLKLAFQSAIMVCFEYWIFEIFIILSGLFPQPEISTSLIALCESTEAIVYMLITGYGAAISTRVANELGAGCPSVAKSAICLTVKIGILVAIIVSMFLFLADSVWASAFTNSERIKTKFSSMVPLLSASILLDALQGIFSGVARGCGCQALAAYTNLLSFYVIVMPVALILGFVLKLHDKGLWIGLICGLFFQSVIMIIITLRIDWTKEGVVEQCNAMDFQMVWDHLYVCMGVWDVGDTKNTVKKKMHAC